MSSFQSVGEILKNSKIKAKLDNHYMDMGICPECGSDKTDEGYVANGPDDCDRYFTCRECGFYATS
jgi:hypothetical protein